MYNRFKPITSTHTISEIVCFGSQLSYSGFHSDTESCLLASVMTLLSFGQDINDVLFSYCSTSPRHQHNQISVACRATNISWRRMHRPVLLDLLDHLICDLVEHHAPPYAPFPLQDVLDIIWVIETCARGFMQWKVSYSEIYSIRGAQQALAYFFDTSQWLINIYFYIVINHWAILCFIV